MKDFGGSQIAESFSRSIVESVHVEFKHGRRPLKQLLILREKLTQQTIRVFVRSALPGTAGVGKVDIELQTPSQCLVFRELGAIVDGDAVACCLWNVPERSFCRSIQADRSLVTHPGSHQIATAAIQKCCHVSTVSTAHDRIIFPVPHTMTCFDHRRMLTRFWIKVRVDFFRRR